MEFVQDKKYTVEHENVKVHFGTLKDVSNYTKGMKNAKIIEHHTIYEISNGKVKINKII